MVGVALLVGSVAATWGSASGAAADGDSAGFVGLASAQGLRASYFVPDYVAVAEVFDVGGPTAQSTVDTTGKASASAALPYPGDNVLSGPGLIAFATGQSVPGFPFYVRADHPVTPHGDVTDPSGAYRISADAQAGEAASSAGAAMSGDKPASVVRSTTKTVVGNGTAAVEAASVMSGLSLGDGVLRIATVTSRSTTKYRSGTDEPETASELLVEGAKVGDTPVTIGPDGIHAGASGSAPVPVAGTTDQVNAALAQAGISVRTVASAVVAGGSASDVLEIRARHTFPVPDGPKGDLVLRFGGATTVVSLGAAGGLLPPAVDGAVPAPVSEPGPGDASGLGEAAAAGALRDAGPVPTPSASAGIGAPGGGPDTSAGGGSFTGTNGGSDQLAAGDPAAGPTEIAEAATGSPDEVAEVVPVTVTRDLSNPMRVLLGAMGALGALLVASSTLWRGKGGSARWTS